MAFDFSKLNFFSRLDARARVFFLLAVVVSMIFIIYLAVRLIWGSGGGTGATQVAGAPPIQSTPGGKLSPEYYHALMQANALNAQQASMKGTSSIPTLVNVPNGQQPECNIICSDQMASINPSLDNWVKQAQINPDIATALEQLAANNVPVSEFANQLAQLVKDGKLTPEQARELLEQYKKQHANALLQQAAKAMDPMITSGELPLEVANALLTALKNGATACEYSAKIQEFVDQGKITVQTGQRLNAQFIQQCTIESTKENLANVNQMAHNGEITADIAKNLADLTTKNSPLGVYQNTLRNAVDHGKLTPAAAGKLATAYTLLKTKCGCSLSLLSKLLAAAEAAAYQELNDLLKAGKISTDTARQISDMIKQNVSLEDFTKTINAMVVANKITPEIAKLKIADYQKIKSLRNLAEKLTDLQGNNATAADYADALKAAVVNGTLTPDEAAALMKAYESALTAPTGAPPPELGTTPDAQAFAKLQQAVQQNAPAQAGQEVPPEEFQAVQTEAQAGTSQDRQAHIQALLGAMQSQANALVNAWAPPTMQHKEGTVTVVTGRGGKGGTATGAGGAAIKTTTTTTTALGPPIIKSGTILFAVLDTAVNSDYPTSPVLATIVAGKYKGAKLLGQLVTAKNVAGQMDRISLNFTLMNMDQWPTTKTIKAFAIDPDTARVVMASDVNHHYLMRFGAIMGTAFLQGYAQSITNAGTSTTGIFGTSTTHPALSGKNKFFVGLGQLGQTLGQAIQPWINIPPTVKVDSGVGLGILFMSDVT